LQLRKARKEKAYYLQKEVDNHPLKAVGAHLLEGVEDCLEEEVVEEEHPHLNQWQQEDNKLPNLAPPMSKL